MWMPFIFGTDIFLQLGQKAFAFFLNFLRVFFAAISVWILLRNQRDLNPRSLA